MLNLDCLLVIGIICLFQVLDIWQLIAIKKVINKNKK